MALLILEAEKESKLQPRRIICRDKNNIKLATIYVDKICNFQQISIGLPELKEIGVVADNFLLFFDNLQKS